MFSIRPVAVPFCGWIVVDVVVLHGDVELFRLLARGERERAARGDVVDTGPGRAVHGSVVHGDRGLRAPAVVEVDAERHDCVGAVAALRGGRGAGPEPRSAFGVGRLVVVEAHRPRAVPQQPRLIAVLLEHEGDLGVSVLVRVVGLADRARRPRQLPFGDCDHARIRHSGQVPLRPRGVRESEADVGVLVEPVAESDGQPEVLAFVHDCRRLERRDRLRFVVVHRQVPVPQIARLRAHHLGAVLLVDERVLHLAVVDLGRAVVVGGRTQVHRGMDVAGRQRDARRVAAVEQALVGRLAVPFDRVGPRLAERPVADGQRRLGGIAAAANAPPAEACPVGGVRRRRHRLPVRADALVAVLDADLEAVLGAVVPPMRSYSTNAKGNFQFDRVISGWRNRPVLDLRLKR